MVSTQRRSRSGNSEVASRSLMARIPVSGVRTSWAKAASAASTTPADVFVFFVFALAFVLLGSGRWSARRAEAFCFNGTFLRFTRLVRLTRDFVAMTFIHPALATAWHGRATGVTDTFQLIPSLF